MCCDEKMVLASSKLYGNDEIHIPKAIKKAFKQFQIDEDTIFDWDIKDNEIILTPRKKVKLDDIIGIIDEGDDEYDIDKMVYLDE